MNISIADGPDICCDCGCYIGVVRRVNKDRTHAWLFDCDDMVCHAQHSQSLPQPSPVEPLPAGWEGVNKSTNDHLAASGKLIGDEANPAVVEAYKALLQAELPVTQREYARRIMEAVLIGQTMHTTPTGA